MSELSKILLLFGLMFVSALLLILFLIRFNSLVQKRMKKPSSLLAGSVGDRWASLSLLLGLGNGWEDQVEAGDFASTIKFYRVFSAIFLAALIIGFVGVGKILDANPRALCPRGASIEECPAK